MSNIIFFDTETTGFAKAGVQPRILQLGWQIFSIEGLPFEFGQYVSLIKPDGWYVPASQFHIQHGYSQQKSEEFGEPIKAVLDRFILDCNSNEVEYMVAHNLAYDVPVLAAEMKLAERSLGRNLKKMCTMVTYAAHFGGKWPKLIDAHTALLGVGFEGAHDAMADVSACASIFFEMKKRGIIKL